MHFQLADDATVRLDETGWIRSVVATGIGHADPEKVGRGATLHRLTHDYVMDRGSVLAGVVKGLKDTLDFLFFEFAIQLGKTKIKADQ